MRWPWPPVGDTIRLGQPDATLASSTTPLVGPVDVGLGPMPSVGGRLDPTNWASWRLLHDTLLVSSPGINQSIVVRLFPVVEGFTGGWIVQGEASELERGQVQFLRISCP